MAGDGEVNLFDLAAQRGNGGGGQGAGAGEEMDAAEVECALDFLRTSPQFQQLRQVVQANPQMLGPLLQQLGTGNPAIARLIAENPDQFLNLLREDGDDEDGQLPAGAHPISVTEEERDAIERVCATNHNIVLH